MSWSFSAVGKPEAVKRAIEESPNNNLTGVSRQEWDEAKPALLALVGANVGKVAVRVSANGHASFETRAHPGLPDEQVKVYGQCACTIEPMHGFIE
jgi:hypothetical protein